MSGFSSEWLALREPADQRSRNPGLAEKVRAQFAGHRSINVVDLGCGTGSNLRALAPLLGAEQAWTLVDNDLGLLGLAKGALSTWADSAEEQGGELDLQHGGRLIRVRFRAADLARGPASLFSRSTDLVTASAFFDLASPKIIERLAEAVTESAAAFYTVLTYNGIQRWTPEHPADGEMAAAFRAHQMTDKGLGSAAGPNAARHLARAFAALDYNMSEGDSPWVLGPRDAKLIRMLESGFVDAVRETGRVDPALIAAWSSIERSGAEVGHTDTLALPER